jgi:hypothetical protein
MFANNYISTIVENQLPEFIRADHPTFVTLLKKYYEYMEQPNKTLNVGKDLYDYMDVDTTKVNLIKYFKNKIIPNFPEETELSTEKLIKAAKYYYSKKGSAESFKFLFKTLYGQEVDIYFPKEDILKASDGKWKLPQAIRLAFTDVSSLVSGGNVNVFAASANTISANGFNIFSKGITANSYIRIGDDRRQVVTINTAGDFLTVNIPFANTKYANGSVIPQTYDSTKFYKVELNEYTNFNIKLLERKLGIGEISRTTCVIEKAVLTVDGETGREFVELYVSNVKRLFEPGENLVVEYTDENDVSQTFKSKIVSLISNITLFKNRFGVVQTGRKYKKGDPVVLHGGLKDSPDAVKAIAVVNNVSTGSIESVEVIEPGYFFRTDPNSLIRVLSTSGIGANLLISGIWDDGGANSNTFQFNTDSIVYKKDISLNDIEYDFDNVTTFANLTAGAGNTTTTINLNTSTHIANTTNDYYKSFIIRVVSGTGSTVLPNTAKITAYNGTTKIATLSPALNIAVDNTSNVKIFANAQTEIGRAFTYETITLGKVRALDLEDGGSFFEEPPTFDAISLHESDYSLDQGFLTIPSGQFSNYDPLATPPTIRLNSSNSSYSLANGFYTGSRLFLDVGDTAHYTEVLDYVVENPSSSSNTKTLYLDRQFENNINQTNILNFALFLDFRPNVRGTGKIGVMFVKTGGSGYNDTNNVIEFVGTGYGANAYQIVDANGAITSVVLDNRGEGYPVAPSVIIRDKNTGNIASGTGASFEIYMLSDGEEFSAETSDIGRIQDFRIINRGFEYANTPITSLKVVDVLTDNLAASLIVLSGDSVWQGSVTNANAIFRGTIDDVYRSDSTNTVLRIFNYSGSLNTAQALRVATAGGNASLNISTSNATISFNDINDAVERKYPFFYGNGLAKANAEFLNGLIKYDGFFLNTDGFLSADKKLQNKNYYHNFSYEISSEKSLNDYKEPVYRVGHPAGMHLLSKYMMKNIVVESVSLASNLHTSNTAQATNANTSYTSNVLFGNNSSFLTSANVGDLIVINTTETAEYKRYTRVIANVVDANTIWLESPIGGTGDGLLRTVNGNANVVVFANSVAVTESLEASDNISFNISETIYDRFVVSTPTSNIVLLNAAVTATGNVVYKKNPTYNVVSYKIIRI